MHIAALKLIERRDVHVTGPGMTDPLFQRIKGISFPLTIRPPDAALRHEEPRP
jgi:hypothetical protein